MRSRENSYLNNSKIYIYQYENVPLLLDKQGLASLMLRWIPLHHLTHLQFTSLTLILMLEVMNISLIIWKVRTQSLSLKPLDLMLCFLLKNFKQRQTKVHFLGKTLKLKLVSQWTTILFNNLLKLPLLIYNLPAFNFGNLPTQGNTPEALINLMSYFHILEASLALYL